MCLMSPVLAGRFFTTATREALPLQLSLTQLQAHWPPHCFWNMPRTSSWSEYLPGTPPRELTALLSPPSVLYAKVTFSGHQSSACNQPPAQLHTRHLPPPDIFYVSVIPCFFVCLLLKDTGFVSVLCTATSSMPGIVPGT